MKHGIYSLCALLFSFPAVSAMTVYPMETAVGKNGTAQIRVISQDDDVQFIKIRLKKIINPGTKNEHEVDADMSDPTQIIVTPQKIALATGAERVVRIVSLTPPPRETTWRVYFEGVSETVFDTFPGEKNQAKTTAKIGVNIIWGALVHVAPRSAVPGLKYNPATGKIINDGTIRIPVKEIGVCRIGGECTWTKKDVVFYPESELSVTGIRFSPENTYKVKYFNWLNDKTEEMTLPAQQVN